MSSRIPHLKELSLKAQAGDELAFKRLFTELSKALKPFLATLVHNDIDEKEIFVQSMEIYWQRFIVGGTEVPEDPLNYFRRMCKNAHFQMLRKRDKQLELKEGTFFEYKWAENGTTDFALNQTINYRKKKAVTRAVEELSGRDKQLFELHIEQGKRLKDVQLELGFGTYQSIVQAKYNFKKRFAKRVFQLLSEIEHQTQKDFLEKK